MHKFICANNGFENDLLFNRSKSVCLVVQPRGRNVSNPLKLNFSQYPSIHTNYIPLHHFMI